MTTLAEIEHSFDQYDGESGLAGLESALGLSANGDVSQRVDAIFAEVAHRVAAWEQVNTVALLPDRACFDAVSKAIARADWYAMMQSPDGMAAVGDGVTTWPDCWWGHLAARFDERGLWDRLWSQIFREGNAERAEPVMREERAISGKHAADALHGKPGGSREKRDAIRAAWASGKYTSRDRCAEEECAALDMSLSAARKALRNTPAPT